MGQKLPKPGIQTIAINKYVNKSIQNLTKYNLNNNVKFSINFICMQFSFTKVKKVSCKEQHPYFDLDRKFIDNDLFPYCSRKNEQTQYQCEI